MRLAAALSAVSQLHCSRCPGCHAASRAEQCADRDANTMSVMKAALPDDDELLAGEPSALSCARDGMPRTVSGSGV